MSDTKIPCPLCGSIDAKRDRDGVDTLLFHCGACHDYRITEQAMAELETPKLTNKRFVLAGVARNASESGKPFTFLSSNVQELVDNTPVAQSPLDVLDALLLRIADGTRSFAGATRIPPTDWTKYYLRSPADLGGVLDFAHQLGYVNHFKKEPSGWLTRLSATGWQRVQELREHIPKSRQAFVAMHFAHELKSAYTDGIRPALMETGYQPLRIDEVHHNDKIDDRIVAELRRSGLVVADFTNQRGGVYFEAGYAVGRGIPVIWCCRQDDIENAHFDTRQFNHITWTTPEELRAKLRDRIRATLTTYPAIE